LIEFISVWIFEMLTSFCFIVLLSVSVIKMLQVSMCNLLILFWILSSSIYRVDLILDFEMLLDISF